MQQATIPMEKICMMASVLMADMGHGYGFAVADDLYQTIEGEFEEAIW